jgi:polyhydroxybutyrate depolymerase
MFRVILLSIAIGFAIIASPFATDEVQAGPIRNTLKALRERRAAKKETQGTTQTATDGLQKVTINSGGMQRSYFIHLPPNFSATRQMPVVMVLHGGQGSGEKTAQSSGMVAAADQYGFVAVFPNAGDRQWNDGRSTTVSNIDDVQFIRDVLNNMKREQGIDRSRVYVTGISNGGILVQRLACEATRDFAAYAVVAANMPSALQPSCRPSRRAPIMFFNGTTDPLMPYNGGEIKRSKLLNMGAGGKVISTPSTISFWASVNGCSTPREAAMPDTAADGTRVVAESFASCSRGDVVAYRIDGGGHTWPGSNTRETRVTGKISKDISATSLMLGFFREYGM